MHHKFTAPEVLYEANASGNQRRRPIELLRTLYRRDDLTGLLPLGDLQPLALPGESYKLAFTPGLPGVLSLKEEPHDSRQSFCLREDLCVAAPHGESHGCCRHCPR